MGYQNEQEHLLDPIALLSQHSAPFKAVFDDLLIAVDEDTTSLDQHKLYNYTL